MMKQLSMYNYDEAAEYSIVDCFFHSKLPMYGAWCMVLDPCSYCQNKMLKVIMYFV